MEVNPPRLCVQISGVELAVTDGDPKVSHVVSEIAVPVPPPQPPVQKYPVVPGGTVAIFRTPPLYGKVCPNVFCH